MTLAVVAQNKKKCQSLIRFFMKVFAVFAKKTAKISLTFSQSYSVKCTSTETKHILTS